MKIPKVDMRWAEMVKPKIESLIVTRRGRVVGFIDRDGQRVTVLGPMALALRKTMPEAKRELL